MLMSVVLPAPFSPSSACTSPHRASKSTARLATTPGNALSMPVISTAFIAPQPIARASGALRNVAHDVAQRPVHLVGLHICVVSGLARLWRAIKEVAQRLAFGRLDIPVVIGERSLPDIERSEEHTSEL